MTEQTMTAATERAGAGVPDAASSIAGQDASAPTAPQASPDAASSIAGQDASAPTAPQASPDAAPAADERADLVRGIAVTDEEHGVGLTKTARDKIESLLRQEGREDLRLRVAVQPGGCSGLIYQLYFDERTLEGDAIMSFDPVEVVVDEMSVPYLDGSTIDFEDTIQKQGFTIDNPNARSSCACGDSFA